MRVLVTGSSGHLGEALMRVLPGFGHDPVGLDRKPGPFTHHVAAITDRQRVRACMAGMDALIHTATLHKPHVVTHSHQDFVDTNITGTLCLLEAARDAGVGSLVFTSTTSAFGSALTPGAGAPTAWIDETVAPVPKNIYGVTKVAVEDLCELFHRRFGLAILVLRTSRFFPEEDDSAAVRAAYTDQNAKANEVLFRRIDLLDAATAHIAALDRAPSIGFGRFVVSATTPFMREDVRDLNFDAPGVVERRIPAYAGVYAEAGFRMFPSIDRVYDNCRAREELGWAPVFDFRRVLAQIAAGAPIGSDLARLVGVKGYHDQRFEDGPYPVE